MTGWLCAPSLGLSGNGPVPDATTLLHFRYLPEGHDLTRSVFSTINRQLASEGLLVREGTIVDARIIAAPSFDQEQDQGARPHRASN